MPNSKLVSKSLLHALGVLVYVALVVWFMNRVEQMFDAQPAPFWGPLAFLMLFVLSAAIVGLLVFVKPVMMYLDGTKKEAISLLIYTLGWLALITLVIIGIVFSQN